MAKRFPRTLPLDLQENDNKSTALLCSCGASYLIGDLMEKVAFAEEGKAVIVCDFCGKKQKFKITYQVDENKIVVTILSTAR